MFGEPEKGMLLVIDREATEPGTTHIFSVSAI